MAVIGSIRKRGTLLLLVIGFAMVAFILGDLFSNRGGSVEQTVGEIAGEKVNAREFSLRVDSLVDAYTNEFSQPVSAEQRDQIRNQIWNQMLREKVVISNAKEAGIQLHKEEYDDVRFGENMLDDFKNDPNLKDPVTGQVNKKMLIDQLNQIQEVAPNYYQIQKRNVIQSRMYNKYMNLIKNSMFVTGAEAALDAKSRTSSANFQFVLKEYNASPDSLYEPSDSELRSYYEAHKNEKKYNQQASRAIEFVRFPIVPTEEDEMDARDQVNRLKEEYRTATNDSLFVVRESDEKNYVLQPYKAGSQDVVTDSLIVNAQVGDVIGPYKVQTSYTVSKVKELKDLEEATVRHILIKTGDNSRLKDDDAAKVLADSILTAVKRNRGKFEDLVTKYSEDPGSVSNGGKYEWFPKGQMVPEFEEVSFDRPVGTIEIAKTSYGHHIVEVLEQRSSKQRVLASVVKNIVASGATSNAVYKLANDISINHNNPDSFRVVSEQRGATWGEVDQLLSTAQSVPGIPNSAQLVSQAFQMENVGDFSEPFNAGDNHVVLRLMRVREEGVPAFEDVVDRMKPEVIKEKKAKEFVAQMQGKTDLNALGAELGTGVKSANAVTLASTTITGGYAEKDVIGKAFRMSDGEVGGPFIGDQGVYMIQMTSKSIGEDKADYTVDKENLQTQRSSGAEGKIYNAMRKAAGVVDDRRKFF